MGASRLLADREDRSEHRRRGKHAAGQARARTEQHEIERHQREPRSGMRAGKTLPARQLVRTVGEQGDVGTVASKGREVARAVHVGRLLEQSDGRRAQDQRHDQEGRGAPLRGRAIAKDAHGQGEECGQAGQPHQPLAGGMDEVERPPAVGADPVERRGVIESVIGDPEIRLTGCERNPRDGKQAGGNPGVQQPETLALSRRIGF